MRAGQLQLAPPNSSSNDTCSAAFVAVADYSAPVSCEMPASYEFSVDPCASACQACAYQPSALPEMTMAVESPRHSFPDDCPISARTESEYDACSEAQCSEAPSTSASVATSMMAPSRPPLAKAGSRRTASGGAVKRREPKSKASGGGLFFLPTDGVPADGQLRPSRAARSTPVPLGPEVAVWASAPEQEHNEMEVPESIGVEDWEDNFRASDRVAAGSPLHSARLLRGLRSPSEPDMMSSTRSMSLPPSTSGDDDFRPLAPKRRPLGVPRAPPCRLPRIPLPGAKLPPSHRAAPDGLSKPPSPAWDDPSSMASGHTSFRQLVPLPGRKTSSLSAPRRLAPLS